IGNPETVDFIIEDHLVSLDSKAISFRADSNVDDVRGGSRPGPIRCAFNPDDEASIGRFDLDIATLTIDVEAKPHGHLPKAAPAAPPAPTPRPRAARAGMSPRGPTDRSRRGRRQSPPRGPPLARHSDGVWQPGSPR